ncbi:MAG: hypothetical protein WKF95_16825 [Rubrobacter sp.]
MHDDIHRMAEQQMREQQEAARKMREEAIKERMQKWDIERGPAEYILDLELKIQQLEKGSRR